MNKIISLFLILSSILIAKEPPPPTHHHKDMMMCKNSEHKEFDKKIGGDALRFFRRANINLTEEQVNKVYDIAIKFSSKEEPIRLEIQKLDYNLRMEIMQDNPRKEVIKNLILEKKEKEANIDFLKIERDLDIINILTEEQKLLLKERGAPKARGHHHHGK